MGIIDDLGHDLAPCLGVAPQLAFHNDEVAFAGSENIVHPARGDFHFSAKGYRLAKTWFEILNWQDLWMAMDQLLQPVFIMAAIFAGPVNALHHLRRAVGTQSADVNCPVTPARPTPDRSPALFHDIPLQRLREES